MYHLKELQKKKTYFQDTGKGSMASSAFAFLPATNSSRFRFTETPLRSSLRELRLLIRIPRPKRIFSTRLDIRPHRETRPLPLEVNEGPRSSDKDQLAVLSILGNLGLYFIIPSNFYSFWVHDTFLEL